MNKKKMLSMAAGAAVLGTLLGQAGLAAALGCVKVKVLPNPFPVGSASQQNCQDASGNGRVQVLAIGGTTKTFKVTANLLAALGPGEVGTITRVLNGAGNELCNSGTDNNPAANVQATNNNCVTQNSNPATQYRMTSGDNVGP